MHYHRLSSTIIQFELVQIPHDSDDSFSRLATRMIVHDSFSVSYFGNHWSDSGRKHAADPFRREKLILLQVCPTGRHLVFTFLRGKSSELAALVTCATAGELSYY